MSTDNSNRFAVLHEFAEAARLALNDQSWGYIIGGSDTETTMRRNRQSLDSLALRPRVLNDVSAPDSSSHLFNIPSRLPIFLCPIGGLESFDAEGAISVAAAASRFGIPMLLSSVSSRSMEQVTASTGKSLALVLQLYVRENAQNIDAIVDRCLALDLPALCVTVDSAVYSRRERDIADRYVKPWRASGEGDAAHYQAALSWKDIERIRKRWKKPLILKGIATAEDAIIALDYGVDCIYVSNHGGRQLDHVAGSTAVLPEVVAAVKGNASVFVDGGYCRGTDIAKAIALGADGVGIGRMMCLALAADGADGIVRMLELLEEEFQIAMALSGVNRIEQFDQSHVQPCQPLPFEHALHSAFPLMNERILEYSGDSKAYRE